METSVYVGGTSDVVIDVNGYFPAPCAGGLADASRIAHITAHAPKVHDHPHGGWLFSKAP
jgi:hypothetical protein